MHGAGVRPILLKGPSISRWLYTDETRDYVDIDLLVSPQQSSASRAELKKLGFRPSGTELALPHGRRPHAETWVHSIDGLKVDLHSTLPGVGVDSEATWAVLAASTEPMSVGGCDLAVLEPHARAMLLALHAAHHGIEDSQATSDLVRGLEQLSSETWRAAVTVAEQLEATSALAAGLGLTDQGEQLVQTLGLQAPRSIDSILRASSAPELALSLDWLFNARGVRVRARLIMRRLVPRPSVLRGRSPLARHGLLGLAMAYILQPWWLSRSALPAVRAWRAAREKARRVIDDPRQRSSR